MKRELMPLVAALGLTAAATASPVGVYINDDFPGTTLNATTWSNYSSPATAVTVADGTLTGGYAGGDNGAWVFANSPYAVHPEAGQTVVLSSTNLTFGAWASNNWWGLGVGGNTTGICLRQLEASNVRVEITGSSGQQNLYLSAPSGYLTTQFVGAWSISWSPTQVKIVSANLGTVFDSTVQTLDGAGNPWNLPTAELVPVAKAYYSGFTFDNMTLEVTQIPEPASALLLGLALAGLGARKRR